MAPVVTKNSILTAWLYTLLLLLSLPALSYARSVPFDEFRELFPSAKKIKFSDEMMGLTFRLEDCPCFAMTDAMECVRYIFVFPMEKGKKTAQAMEKVQQTAQGLAGHLNDKYGNAKLYAFADGESGHVIALPASSSSTYYSSSSSILRYNTTAAIAKLIGKGYEFHRIDNGEIVLKMPGDSGDNDANYVTFILARARVDVAGFIPNRTLRRSDERVVDAIRAALYDYSFYTADYSSSCASRIKSMRSLTGATKCIALNSGYEIAIVTYRNRYYLGSGENLKNFIRNRKRNSFAGKLDFPQQSNPMPGGGNNTAIAADTGDGGKADSASSTSASSIAELCRLFGCYPPVVRDDMAFLRLRGCKVVIPVPGKEDADLETRLGMPFRFYFMRCDSRDQMTSRKLADVLAQVAKLGKTGTTVYAWEEVVKKTVFAGSNSNRDINAQDFFDAINAEKFADPETHEWPEHTVDGKPLPDDFKALLAAEEEKAGKKQSEQSGGVDSVSPNDALKDYIQYLRRLME